MNRRIIYVASTAILVLEILVGAFMDLAHLPYVVQDVRSIGYPTYVLYIVGVWKVLAVGALLWLRLLGSGIGPMQESSLRRPARRHLMFWSAIPLANMPRHWLSPFSRWSPGGSSRTRKRPAFATRRTDPLVALLVFRARSGGFMAIVMPSEAHDCDEPEKVLSNGRNLSPNTSRGRIVADSDMTPRSCPEWR
jgi:hypothetical protein